jgi:hypothetical protein
MVDSQGQVEVKFSLQRQYSGEVSITRNKLGGIMRPKRIKIIILLYYYYYYYYY